MLNSKAEYNRSRIARLSLGDSSTTQEEEDLVEKEGRKTAEEEVTSWEGKLVQRKDKNSKIYVG